MIQKIHRTLQQSSTINQSYPGTHWQFSKLLGSQNFQRVWIQTVIYFGCKNLSKTFNLYLYIPFNSNHPEDNFKSFGTGELKRYVITNGRGKGFLKMQMIFNERVLKRRYLPSTLYKWFGMVTYDMRHSLIFKRCSPTCVNRDQNDQENQDGNIDHIQMTGEEGISHTHIAAKVYSDQKTDMEGDKELLVYKTKFDKNFKDIGIKQIIANEMKENSV